MIVEARDQQTPYGRKVISDCLNEAMAKREANSAIYVSKTRRDWPRKLENGPRAVLARAVGSHVRMNTWSAAVRFLVVQGRLQQLRGAASAVDAGSIESQIQRIRTSLGKIKNIKTKVTNIRSGANDIEGEADALRSDINGALSEMENALKAAGKRADKPLTRSGYSSEVQAAADNVAIDAGQPK